MELNFTFSDEMPVRPRSRCSICANTCLLLRESSRSSSRSRSTPAAITPPSAKLSGGSSTIVFSMRSRISCNSSMDVCNAISRSAPSRPSAVLIAGIFLNDAARARTSRGFAVSSVTRLRSLSRSRTPSSARRSSSRATISFTPASTESSRP